MQLIRPTLVSLLLFSLLFGGLYPAFSNLMAAHLFPAQATGSLLHDGDGKPLGSALIGQNFSQPQYFWGRLSATTPNTYNASSSGGSNFGVNNPALLDAVKARIADLHQADPANNAPIPVDLVTASGSGLDPDISPAAASYQIGRVARARGLSQEVMRALVAQHTQGRQFGLLGEPRVNILTLNLALDGKQP